MIRASFENLDAWRAIIRTGSKRGTIFKPRNPSTRSNLGASERGVYEDEDHATMLTWIGGVFDPRGFDLNHLNREWRGAMVTGRSR